MKKVLFFALALLFVSAAFGQKRTFKRDYTYRASERDSKVTARAAAIREMQTLLLLEIGQVIQSEQALKKLSATKDGKETFSESFSQEVMAITAGFVEMKIIEEDWDGKTYYVEARMTVDPKEVSQRVAEILNNKQKEKELEEAQKREKAELAKAEQARAEAEKKAAKSAPKTAAATTRLYSAGVQISTMDPLTRIDHLDRNQRRELRKMYQKSIVGKDEVRRMMSTNPEALRLYNKGLKQRTASVLLSLSGLVVSSVGLGKVLNAGDADAAVLGLAIEGVGLTMTIVALPIAISASRNAAKAVNMYNTGTGKRTSSELHFGVTPNGVGLALKF